MRERFLSETNQALQMERIRMFIGLAGINANDILKTDKPSWSVNHSLEGFVDRVNHLELLSPFTMEYHFNRPRGWIVGSWGNFFLDAPRGLLIQAKSDHVQKEESSAVAGIAFSVVGLDSIDPGRYPNLDFLCLKPGDILVAQIQAQKGLGWEQREKLKELKWERSLLGAVFDWAERAGFPRVLVVPAANNYWLTDASCQDIRPSLEKRLFLRYDVTARRCGFQQERENQPYCQETLKKRTHDALWGYQKAG